MSKSLGFDELSNVVVEKGICSGCGACVIVCPFKDTLDYMDERPHLIGECNNCGICLRVCPKLGVQVDELDKLVFGRPRKSDEIFGIYKTLCVSRSMNKDILEAGQDGGVATTILTSALELGLIDGAVVSGIDPFASWLPKPIVVRKKADIIRNAGTRYSYSANLFALNKSIKDGLQRIAYVGTPCQILAIRRMQKANLKKFTNPIAFTIGLFCSESFSYRGLMVEKIQKGLGIDLGDIVKINIKGKMRIYLRNNDLFEITLKEARDYAEQMCSYCSDFSAELADISLGGIGLNGWTFTIVRTDRGAKVFDKVIGGNSIEVRSAFDKPTRLLKRLSISKRNRVIERGPG